MGSLIVFNLLLISDKLELTYSDSYYRNNGFNDALRNFWARSYRVIKENEILIILLRTNKFVSYHLFHICLIEWIFYGFSVIIHNCFVVDHSQVAVSKKKEFEMKALQGEET